MASIESVLYDDIAVKVETLDQSKINSEIGVFSKLMNRKNKKLLLRTREEEQSNYSAVKMRERLQKKLEAKQGKK